MQAFPSRAEGLFELPPPPVAHRAAADVAVLAETVKALANVAGVGMQDLMTLDCNRKFKGTFQAYEGKAFMELRCTKCFSWYDCLGS